MDYGSAEDEDTGSSRRKEEISISTSHWGTIPDRRLNGTEK